MLLFRCYKNGNRPTNVLGTQSDIDIHLSISLEISHFIGLEKETWPRVICSHRWLLAPYLIFFLFAISPTQHQTSLTIQTTTLPDSDFPDLASQGCPDQAHVQTKSSEGQVGLWGPSLTQSMKLLSQEVHAISRIVLALQCTSAPEGKVSLCFLSRCRIPRAHGAM